MNLKATLHYSLKRAERVLFLVDLPVSQAAQDRIHTRTFSNGREQGFTVEVLSPSVGLQLAFAQNRNSDDLVLYVGTPKDFLNNDLPNEAVYGTKKLFPAKGGKHGAFRAAEEKLAREVTKLVVAAAKQAAKEVKEVAKFKASSPAPAPAVVPPPQEEAPAP